MWSTTRLYTGTFVIYHLYEWFTHGSWNSKISIYAVDTFVSNETKSKLDIREELYQDFIKICEGLKQINLV